MAKGKMTTRSAKRRKMENARTARSAKRRKKNGDGRDWAGLPDGIVDCIADLLLKEDVTYYIRFRGVCTSFRLATLDPVVVDPRFRPRNWILISEEPHLQRPKTPWRFVNLSTGKHIRAHVPELSTIGRGRTVLRVVDGLLLFMDDASTALHLLNPFTGGLASLPPLHPMSASSTLRLFRRPEFLGLFTRPEFPRHLKEYVYNVNLVQGSTTVVVSFLDVLACAKPGDTEWSFTTVTMPNLIQSFQDRFYSLYPNGKLSRFEPDQNRITTLYPSLSDPNSHQGQYSLVASDGELLVACRRITVSCVYFEVFKVDLENGKLIQKENIGGRALFIRWRRRAFLVSTSTFPSIVPNSIYYTGHDPYSTTEYHLIGCACHPKHLQLYSDHLVAGPSSWIQVTRPAPPNQLNLYCTTY